MKDWERELMKNTTGGPAIVVLVDGQPVDRLAQHLAAAEARVEELQQQLADANRQLTALVSQQHVLQQDKGELSDQVGAAKETIRQLHADLAYARGENVQLRNKLADQAEHSSHVMDAEPAIVKIVSQVDEIFGKQNLPLGRVMTVLANGLLSNANNSSKPKPNGVYEAAAKLIKQFGGAEQIRGIVLVGNLVVFEGVTGMIGVFQASTDPDALVAALNDMLDWGSAT